MPWIGKATVYRPLGLKIRESEVVYMVFWGLVFREVKVKVSLCLTKHHAMKTYWVSGGVAPRILDLGIRWR
jgi:hypothetical protein